VADLEHGAAEELGALHDDADVAAHVAQPKAPHVAPVHEHLPAGGVVEAQNQVDERALSRVGRRWT
jgi:hypothetical protein